MKKLSFLFLLCMLLAKAAMAATYAGIITDAPTGAPVAGQKVYLCDTSGNPKDSLLTSASGAYSFTPATVPANGFVVYVTACGVTQHSGLYPMALTGGTWNAAICGTPMRFYGGVFGYSSTNGYQFANAKVYLIAVTAINTATGDTTLTAVDSFLTNTQATFDVSYAALPTPWVTNGLRLKAALQPSDPQYANFLPSYFGQAQVPSLSWRGAMAIYYQLHEVDMELINGVNPGGPGFIGGSVLLGANKSAGVGDPLGRRPLILTKSSGEAVAYAYSDAAGHFSFPGVPLGTYNIFGDALGKSNPALTVTLTSTKTSVSNIVFQENSKMFKGSIGDLSAGGPTALDGITVFPNPVKDFVRVNGLDAISGIKTILVSDVTGAEISRQTIEQGSAQVAVGTLPAGVYVLQVQTSAGTASFRITK